MIRMKRKEAGTDATGKPGRCAGHAASQETCLSNTEIPRATSNWLQVQIPTSDAAAAFFTQRLFCFFALFRGGHCRKGGKTR